jgi:hypothetical protein
MIGRIYMITSPKLENIYYIGSTARTLQYRWAQHKILYQLWLAGEANAYAIFPYFNKYGVDKFSMTLLKEYRIADKRQLLAYEQLWINKYGKTAINKRAACQLMPLNALRRLRDQERREADPEAYKKRCKERYQKAKKNPKFVEKQRARSKEWYQANKDKAKKYQKQYHEPNKDKARENAKECREMNKDSIKENAKEYYQANKEKLLLASKVRYEASKETHGNVVKQHYQANRAKILARAAQKIKCGCGSEYCRAGKTNHLRTKKHTEWAAVQIA